jgi:tetratricopeptide (TPR) repeat protein
MNGSARIGNRCATLALVAAAIAALAAGAGCGSDATVVEQRSEGELLAESGWTAFGAGKYVEAAELFEDALAVDSLYADAENGLGWVNLFYGLFNVADDHFERAIEMGLASQEAEAGHAIVAEIERDYPEALAASERVLGVEPQFVYSRRAGIDYRDLHLLRARSFLATGRLLEAKGEVDVINPSNSINPGVPTFRTDLLSEVERLGEALYDF